MAGLGRARLGPAGCGLAWLGVARQGKEGRGKEWRGRAGHGTVWYGMGVLRMNPYTKRRIRRFFRRLIGLHVPSKKTGQWDSGR
jgi:hypothetical protein